MNYFTPLELYLLTAILWLVIIFVIPSKRT
jgi:hypothetical protein